MATNGQKMSGSDADVLNKLYDSNTSPAQQQSKYRPLFQQDGGRNSASTNTKPAISGSITEGEKYVHKAKWCVYGPFIGLPILLLAWAIITFLFTHYLDSGAVINGDTSLATTLGRLINVILGFLGICMFIVPFVGIYYFRKARIAIYGSRSMPVHPWLRYSARMFDLFVAMLIGDLLLFRASSGAALNEGGLTLAILFFWIFIEALLMSTWGTTPGKWLFNIKVQSIGGTKIDFSSSLSRSFSVWLKGLGMGLPIISTITLVSSYGNLITKGIASWDENQFTITHKDVNSGRVAAIIGGFVVFILLMAFLSGS